MTPPAALGTIAAIFVLNVFMLLFPKALGWILVVIFGLSINLLFAYLLFQALTGRNLFDYFKEMTK